MVISNNRTTYKKDMTERGDDNIEDENMETNPVESGTLDGISLRFRNYRPVDKNLNKFIAELSPALIVDDELRDVLNEVEQFNEVDEIDLTTLAPKKVDWDLKRDVQGKLAKVERRTQKAIIELLRQRLMAGKHDLLLSAVNTGVQAAEESHFSDED